MMGPNRGIILKGADGGESLLSRSDVAVTKPLLTLRNPQPGERRARFGGKPTKISVCKDKTTKDTKRKKW